MRVACRLGILARCPRRTCESSRRISGLADDAEQIQIRISNEASSNFNLASLGANIFTSLCVS